EQRRQVGGPGHVDDLAGRGGVGAVDDGSRLRIDQASAGPANIGRLAGGKRGRERAVVAQPEALAVVERKRQRGAALVRELVLRLWCAEVAVLRTEPRVDAHTRLTRGVSTEPLAVGV